MTFRKKDPEFVTLFFMTEVVESVSTDVGGKMEEKFIVKKLTKTRRFRVSKRLEFIEALQVEKYCN